MENLGTYLKNLYSNYSIKELKEELNYFLDRADCANNTNKKQYDLQVEILKIMILDDLIQTK